MGRKLYEKMESGGIRFKSKRQSGHVRIPNYVYDIWMPLLGATAIGIYGVYCRLERQGTVKAMTMQTLATVCRVGKTRLYKINETLESCGFVGIVSPKGHKRLMHWTTEIEVLDPPQEVSPDLIEKYAIKGKTYQTLTPWLVAEEEVERELRASQMVRPSVPNGTSMGVPNGTSNVVYTLDVVSGAAAPNSSPADELDDALGKKRKGMPAPVPKRTEAELLDEIQLASLRGTQRQGEKPWLNWSDGRLKPCRGIDQECLDRIGWLIEKHTTMCPVDSEWKGWTSACADIYQAGQGRWGAIEAGIRAAWGRKDPQYRPGHAKGFVKEVRKAAATTPQPQQRTLTQEEIVQLVRERNAVEEAKMRRDPQFVE